MIRLIVIAVILGGAVWLLALDLFQGERVAVASAPLRTAPGLAERLREEVLAAGGPQEIYVLSQVGGLGTGNRIMLRITEDHATVTGRENGRGERHRIIPNAMFSRLVTFLRAEGAHTLPDLSGGGMFGGRDYVLIRVTRWGTDRVHMSNPGVRWLFTAPDEAAVRQREDAYARLVTVFHEALWG